MTVDCPPEQTTLVERPDERVEYTCFFEGDAATALTRGLAEYLGDLTFTDLNGRVLEFKRSSFEGEDQEEEAMYPAASTMLAGRRNYDATGFTPRRIAVVADALQPRRRFWLQKTAELDAELDVEIYATDRYQRSALVGMLESALASPTDWSYAARLRLPHWFGSFVDYSLESVVYDNTKKQAGLWMATARVNAALSVIRCREFPDARIAVSIDAESASG